MRKMIFVVVNAIAEVSREKEYLSELRKDKFKQTSTFNEFEDYFVILSQKRFPRNGGVTLKKETWIPAFRCNICEAGYTSPNCLHDEFFEKECSCCGATDHSFLDIRHEVEDRNVISLICSCPLANHSVVRESRLSVNNRKHWIDPSRLAKECGYQEKEVEYIMERIQMKGCGRRMCPDDISRIQEAAYHSCETERNMCHFTRDVTHLTLTESEEQGESDEDMMSIGSNTTNSL